MEQKQQYLTHEELLEVIRQKANQLGSKKQFAKLFNINVTSLHYILSGKRKITFALALAMGYRVKLVYIKAKNETTSLHS